MIEIDCCYSLSVDEIWPDGDAPENPTTQDVIRSMRERGDTDPGQIINDWNLEASILVDGVSVKP